jgi:tRNA-modifying protein YgfZ
MPSNRNEMNGNWLAFLQARGARVRSASALDFGDPQAEVRAAQSGDVIAPLAHLSTLGLDGEDAGAFLQGQVSCDVQGLDADHAVLGCYCTPQGRMLANFVLWRARGACRMALAADIAGAVQKRLQMFVLRAKVRITLLDDELVLLGVAGRGGADALREVDGGVPLEPFAVHRGADATTIALSADRFLVAARPDGAAALWERFATRLVPVGPAAWQWLDVVAGVPLVTGPTQDRFIPQMANFELVGGINFRKGCYTGQEVIARAQYRGTVKRRLYLAHVASGEPGAGDPVVGDGEGESAGGTVVNAARAPEGGFDVLAVLQSAAADAADLRLRTADGPKLEIRPLPYAIA